MELQASYARFTRLEETVLYSFCILGSGQFCTDGASTCWSHFRSIRNLFMTKQQVESMGLVYELSPGATVGRRKCCIPHTRTVMRLSPSTRSAISTALPLLMVFAERQTLGTFVRVRSQSTGTLPPRRRLVDVQRNAWDCCAGSQQRWDGLGSQPGEDRTCSVSARNRGAPTVSIHRPVSSDQSGTFMARPQGGAWQGRRLRGHPVDSRGVFERSFPSS